VEKNLFTFSFKKIPKVFTGFLLLLVITEAVNINIIKRLPPRNSTQRILKKIADSRWDADILITGDSFTTGAFYNKDKIFPKSNNLAGGAVDISTNINVTMAGQYFILKRYLEHNKPPKIVFFIISPGIWNSELDNSSDNHFFSLFTEISEIMDIILSTKQINFFIRGLYYKALVSAQYRFYLAEFFAETKDRKLRMLRYLRNFFLGNTRAGGEELLDEIFKPYPFGGENQAYDIEKMASMEMEGDRYKFSTTTFAEYYFNKLCSMLKRRGIKVYYIDNSVPYSVFKTEQGKIYISEARNFVKGLEGRNNNFFYLEDFMPSFLEDKFFWDLVHLNEEGAIYYLRLFKKRFNNPAGSLISK